MKRFILTLAAALLLASCASGPGLREDDQPETAKQCGNTPRRAASTLLQGVGEMSIGLLRSVIAKGASLFGIFGNGDDEELGRKVVARIVANPAVAGASGSCECSLLSIEDTAEKNEKVIMVRRHVTVDDELIDFKMAFLVHFGVGNCIMSIKPISKWERMPD